MIGSARTPSPDDDAFAASVAATRAPLRRSAYLVCGDVRAWAGIAVAAALVLVAGVGPLRFLDRDPSPAVPAGAVVFGTEREVMCFYADDSAFTGPRGEFSATSIDGARAMCAHATGAAQAESYACFFRESELYGNYAELHWSDDREGVAIFPVVVGRPTTCAARGLAPTVPNPRR